MTKYDKRGVKYWWWDTLRCCYGSYFFIPDLLLFISIKEVLVDSAFAALVDLANKAIAQFIASEVVPSLNLPGGSLYSGMKLLALFL